METLNPVGAGESQDSIVLDVGASAGSLQFKKMMQETPNRPSQPGGPLQRQISPLSAQQSVDIGDSEDSMPSRLSDSEAQRLKKATGELGTRAEQLEMSR